MDYRQGVENAAMLFGVTLLFVVAIVALVLLATLFPGGVLLVVSALVVGVLLYVFVWRDEAEEDGIRWQY